jgi:hypothetical protein
MLRYSLLLAILEAKLFAKCDVKRAPFGKPQQAGVSMAGNTTADERYLELTALLIDREITKFRRGEQAARVSFSNVAKLARNASEELMAPGARERVGRSDVRPRADLHQRSA